MRVPSSITREIVGLVVRSLMKSSVRGGDRARQAPFLAAWATHGAFHGQPLNLTLGGCAEHLAAPEISFSTATFRTPTRRRASALAPNCMSGQSCSSALAGACAWRNPQPQAFLSQIGAILFPSSALADSSPHV